MINEMELERIVEIANNNRRAFVAEAEKNGIYSSMYLIAVFEDAYVSGISIDELWNISEKIGSATDAFPVGGKLRMIERGLLPVHNPLVYHQIKANVVTHYKDGTWAVDKRFEEYVPVSIHDKIRWVGN